MEIEKSILASIIFDENALHEVIGKLVVDDFRNSRHKKIMAEIINMFEENKPVDVITLSEELKEKGKLESVGGTYYLNEILNDLCHTTENLEYYIKRLKLNRYRENLKRVGIKLSKLDEKNVDINELIDDAEDILLKIVNYKASAQSDLEKAANYIKQIEKELNSDEEIRGFETGIMEFDKMTEGIDNDDLVIIGARPSVGKTAVALNIADFAAFHAKKKVAIFSLEMSKRKLTRRLLSIRSWLSKKNFKKYEDRFNKATEELKDMDIFIDDSSYITALDIKAKAKKLQKQSGLDLIIIDYLQLMQSVKKYDNQHAELSEISRSLKLLAKELQVPVIALSQLNRESEKRIDTRPRLAELKGSGSMEQDGDIICLLHRERKDGMLSKNTELIIAKQREGPIGIVNLLFVPETGGYKQNLKKI